MQNPPDQFEPLYIVVSGWILKECFSCGCVHLALLGPVGVQKRRHSSYLAELKNVISHVSYQRLVLEFFFCSLAFQFGISTKCLVDYRSLRLFIKLLSCNMDHPSLHYLLGIYVIIC